MKSRTVENNKLHVRSTDNAQTTPWHVGGRADMLYIGLRVGTTSRMRSPSPPANTCFTTAIRHGERYSLASTRLRILYATGRHPIASQRVHHYGPAHQGASVAHRIRAREQCHVGPAHHQALGGVPSSQDYTHVIIIRPAFSSKKLDATLDSLPESRAPVLDWEWLKACERRGRRLNWVDDWDGHLLRFVSP